MSDQQVALRGQATELFAGIAVSNFSEAVAWYERLLGCPPTFFPNEVEAVWTLGAQRWLYIILDPARAGGAVQTIICNDLERLIEEIAGRGLAFAKEEIPAEGVRKVMYYDPDGNEIGLGRIPQG